jgi:Flp pilus assembly protein TadD
MTHATIERPPRRTDGRAGAVAAFAMIVAAASLSAVPASATSKAAAKAAAETRDAEATAALVRQALDEQRYTDASSILDRASILGPKSAELDLLRGEVLLARGQFGPALEAFRAVDTVPSQKAAAEEGEGIALSQLGRSDEALATLKAASALDKTQWRAWNALGREYDLRRDWPAALAAYAAALDAPGAKTAVVLNNRGYSYLIQNRPREAAADLVTALAKDPGLAAARTNLRMALAFEGSYDRASMTGAGDDRAAILNNVGLAAAVRGDYVMAEKYLKEAMAIRSQFYSRAAENLQLARALSSRKEDAGKAATDDPR